MKEATKDDELENDVTRPPHHQPISDTNLLKSRNPAIGDRGRLVKIEEGDNIQDDPLSDGKRAFEDGMVEEGTKNNMQPVLNTSGIPPKLKGVEKLDFRLEDVMSALTKLKLKAMKCGDYVVIMKSEFDVVISGEPFHALMMLFNLHSGNFMTRVWNQTVKYGNVTTVIELSNVCTCHFKDRRLCLGLFESEHEHREHKFLISQTPVARRISRRCKGTLNKDAGAQEYACIECIKLGSKYVNEIDMHKGSEMISQHDKSEFPKHEQHVDEMNFQDSEQTEMNVDETETKVEAEHEDSVVMDSLLEVKIEEDEEYDEPGAIKGKAKCKICGYTTRTRALLARHMTTHSEERPFECSVCQKSFKTIDSLRTHEERHKDSKRYQCDFCEATFATTGECLNHTRRRHTGEKPHK